MKQIFTLCAAIVLSLTSAFGQINQTFETVTSLQSLTDVCWQFSGAYLATANNASGAKSIGVYPTTNGASARIITPYINLTNATNISFAYKISNKLSNGAIRTITVRLQDNAGVYTSLGTASLTDNSSQNTLFSFSSPANLTGIQKLVIDVTGSGDGNTYLFVDNIVIDATFNYNSPYSCNTSQSPLPIHLKSFQGLVANDKAQLQWAVADNETGNFFEIQKSNDGREFKTIAIVSTTQKTGDEVYSYNDDLQTSAYYRLKLINKGSTIIYSDVLFIKKQGSVASTLGLLQNPVKNNLKFTFTSDVNSQTQVSVYNMLGVKVFQSSFAASKGANTISKTLDGQIKGGTYVLEVKNATNRSIAKFLKD